MQTGLVDAAQGHGHGRAVRVVTLVTQLFLLALGTVVFLLEIADALLRNGGRTTMR